MVHEFDLKSQSYASVYFTSQNTYTLFVRVIVILNTLTLPAHATVGPSALARAPSDRNIPMTFPFSSPSPVISDMTITTTGGAVQWRNVSHQIRKSVMSYLEQQCQHLYKETKYM